MNIKGLTIVELQDYLGSLNLPKFRATQIFEWLYQQKVCSWEEMTNLPKSLRHFFSEHGVSLGCLTLVNQAAAPDHTVKYLFELDDGHTVESVYIPETDRNTVCFSTQVGCGMGCIFCATGQTGLSRNLSVSEIIDQVLSAGRITGTNINNLVAMGQGEPLANYEALMKAIRIINDPHGLGIGARHITISTCGLIPKIYQLAGESLQVNLAISLHAADDELRNQLMPINKSYPLKELFKACREYTDRTGRRLTFEYALIKNVNDRAMDLHNLIACFAELGERSRVLYHINLIPYNPIPASNFERSTPQRIKEFAASLNRTGIETTIRKERGSNLAAACGQLQGKWVDLSKG